MANAMLVILMKTLMILIFTSWVCVWFITPTGIWKKSWRVAEDDAKSTFFGYSGLNFAVYSFPILAVAILGFIYLHLNATDRTSWQGRSAVSKFSMPILIRSPVGVLSGAELLAAALFIVFLAWTFYSRISNDFKKMIPNKSLKLNEWELKVMKVGTRLGSLSEACLALMLLPVLRRLSIFQLLGLQFEASVRYHIWLSNAMMLFSTLHGLITIFIWAVKHQLGNQIKQWQPTGRVNIAGVITLAVGLIIWITSLPPIRRKRFELFYYTHHLYPVFLLFFLFHGGDRHFYAVLGGVLLFALDRILRLIQSSQVTCLISARILPCKAIELTLPKHPGTKYQPTSIIFIKIPCISSLEWHPFSITSSSSLDKDTISVVVKCQGRWTNQLYNKIDAPIDSDNGLLMCVPVAVEGPYGPASLDYQRYDGLILIAGGIGITPFISILREFASKSANNKSFTVGSLQLIYVVKKPQDLSMLNSIWPLLLDPPTTGEQVHVQLKVFVTQEDRSSDIRVKDQLLSEVKMVSFDTTNSHSNCTISGPESLLWMATIVAFSTVTFFVFLLILNHAFLRPETQTSKKKNPSWVSDLLILWSFVIAIVCSALATVLLRWRKEKSEIHVASPKQDKGMERHSIEEKGTMVEPEIHLGERPDFQGLLSDFSMQTEGSNIGVLVCGPESMQESVASACRRYSHKFNMDGRKRKPSFSYNSLSFSL
ncbi:ferric reduction oxidase 8, mitochondrial [Magnolia sinica]|uniref:ferric reduction oxidase 8, mitochondrial n=1 Tax=Magnolia sinica TaxID=86752 RepID=UPI00265B1BA0|nr:ferric reduction oxidase 8, mitochondrial [Magnolia sinica]